MINGMCVTFFLLSSKGALDLRAQALALSLLAWSSHLPLLYACCKKYILINYCLQMVIACGQWWIQEVERFAKRKKKLLLWQKKKNWILFRLWSSLFFGTKRGFENNYKGGIFVAFFWLFGFPKQMLPRKLQSWLLRRDIKESRLRTWKFSLYKTSTFFLPWRKNPPTTNLFSRIQLLGGAEKLFGRFLDLKRGGGNVVLGSYFSFLYEIT